MPSRRGIFIDVSEEVVAVPLSRGRQSLIDRLDADRVGAFTWTLWPAGKQFFYAGHRFSRNASGRAMMFLHRFILEYDGPLVVDHINGDTLDNRRCNLRIATVAENVANSKPVGARRFKGVSLKSKRTDRWRAALCRRHLGYFASPEEAARAFDEAAIQKYGEFAWLNFPRGSTS